MKLCPERQEKPETGETGQTSNLGYSNCVNHDSGTGFKALK